MTSKNQKKHNNRLLKTLIYSTLLIVSSVLITTYSIGIANNNAVKIAIPENNCDIRDWYNFQVVAIPQLNNYWIEQGISLQARSKNAGRLNSGGYSSGGGGGPD